MTEEEKTELFFEIHSSLPREGPGNYESTCRAFNSIKELPDHPRILDIGCGPGAQTIDLSRLSNGTIIAVDFYAQYVKTLQQKIVQNNLSDRINAQIADMFNLQFPDNYFDLIWSEGAIYIIGFEKGLREWQKKLKPGGYIAVSEISWLKENPPAKIRTFWEENYPAIDNIEKNLKLIKKAGLKPVNHFTLAENSWWDDYYNPLQKRIDYLKEKYSNNKQNLEFLNFEQLEIELFRQYSEFYSYVFYICRL